MSKLGRELIDAVEEANEKGLVTLQTSPDVAILRKKLKLSHFNSEFEILRSFFAASSEIDSFE